MRETGFDPTLVTPSNLPEITEKIADLIHHTYPEWLTTGPVLVDDVLEEVSFLIRPFEEDPQMEVKVTFAFWEG